MDVAVSKIDAIEGHSERLQRTKAEQAQIAVTIFPSVMPSTDSVGFVAQFG
jgi:hypothetical protein